MSLSTLSRPSIPLQDAQITTSIFSPSVPFERLRTRATNAKRDQRLQARALHEAGFKYQEIAVETGLTLWQIQYAVTYGFTPIKGTDRRLKLSETEL